MSEAPERIWLLDWAIYGGSAMWAPSDEYPVDPEPEDADFEYIRADLAGLPEEHLKLLRQMRDEIVVEGHYGWGNALSDILAWHENQGGGK